MCFVLYNADFFLLGMLRKKYVFMSFRVEVDLAMVFCGFILISSFESYMQHAEIILSFSQNWAQSELFHQEIKQTKFLSPDSLLK